MNQASEAPLATVEMIGHLHSQGVVPILTITDASTTSELLNAIYAGGMRHVEITIRTPDSMRALEHACHDQHRAMVVGAGTVLEPAQYEDAIACGAKFIVSPGAPDALLQKWHESPWPFYPGAATVSEAIRLREVGLKRLKFFPAESSGGPQFLRSVHSVLPDISFMPTGGISVANLASYLELPNVCCVGGSWLAPPDLVLGRDWAGIQRRVAAAVTQVQAVRSQ